MNKLYIKFSLLLFLLCLLSAPVLGQTKTVLDNFSTISYSNNNGTTSWSSDWTELGDNNNPNGGFISITNGEELKLNYIWAEKIKRSIDLSAAVSGRRRLSEDLQDQSGAGDEHSAQRPGTAKLRLFCLQEGPGRRSAAISSRRGGGDHRTWRSAVGTPSETDDAIHRDRRSGA